jgi:hypothetical protein
MMVDPASFFGALLDGERHLFGLAVAEADATGAVADHHERGEREPAAALDDLGDAVDVDDPRVPELRLTRGTLVPTSAAIVAASVASTAAAALTSVLSLASVLSLPLVRGRCVGHQNSNPAWRAASASAATRP